MSRLPTRSAALAAAAVRLSYAGLRRPRGVAAWSRTSHRGEQAGEELVGEQPEIARDQRPGVKHEHKADGIEVRPEAHADGPWRQPAVGRASKVATQKGAAARNHRSVTQVSAGDAAQRRHAILANAAFAEAAGRRFGTHGTRAAARAFVADVRARSAAVRDRLDQAAGVQVLLAAIADATLRGLEPWVVRSTQLVLLAAMIDDTHLNDAQLEEFLAAARALAASMLA